MAMVPLTGSCLDNMPGARVVQHFGDQPLRKSARESSGRTPASYSTSHAYTADDAYYYHRDDDDDDGYYYVYDGLID